MNALYLDGEGEVFDYHDGVKDLRAGKVRFVGDPATRIREDVLRLLRFYRFNAWYGKGAADEAARAACRASTPLLPTLSGERVQAELLKLLGAKDPVPSLTLMQEDGVLARIVPKSRPLDVVARLIEARAETRRAAPARGAGRGGRRRARPQAQILQHRSRPADRVERHRAADERCGRAAPVALSHGPRALCRSRAADRGDRGRHRECQKAARRRGQMEAGDVPAARRRSSPKPACRKAPPSASSSPRSKPGGKKAISKPTRAQCLAELQRRIATAPQRHCEERKRRSNPVVRRTGCRFAIRASLNRDFAVLGRQSMDPA